MLQAKMADMYVKLNTARSYTYNVARAMDNGLFPSKVLSTPHLERMFLLRFVCWFVGLLAWLHRNVVSEKFLAKVCLATRNRIWNRGGDLLMWVWIYAVCFTLLDILIAGIASMCGLLVHHTLIPSGLWRIATVFFTGHLGHLFL